MKDNLSPEEKLLNLIKGGRFSKSPALPSREASRHKKIFPGTIGTKSDVQYSVKSLTGTHLTFAYIQKLMLVLAAISCIYLLSSFLYPLLGLKEIQLPETPDNNPPTAFSDTALEKKTAPYEFYLQGLGNRQIFSANSAQEDTVTSSVADSDLIKNISLVGIISGDNPQAVIEDKNLNKTYYLNKGQFIGELQIEDIKEGRVILNFKGQRYELYL